MRLFGSAKPSSATPRPEPIERKPLDADTLTSFYEAAEQRNSGTVPSIYDLEKMCNELKRVEPVRARAALADLRWLMGAGQKYLNANWDHPWS